MKSVRNKLNKHFIYLINLILHTRHNKHLSDNQDNLILFCTKLHKNNENK